MKYSFIALFVLALVTPGFLLGQSLVEIAKEEEERRKKNKESGKEVQVITEAELEGNPGRIANPDATVPPTTPASSPPASSSLTDEEGEDIEDVSDEEVDEEPIRNIPADATLEEKLRLLDAMKASYRQQVADIDAEIQKNNERLAEIQDELVSTGGTGLPTAPQADRQVRDPGNIPALQSEQQQLRRRNQDLEAQKRSIREDILARARRAGIPPGYLNF